MERNNLKYTHLSRIEIINDQISDFVIKRTKLFHTNKKILVPSKNVKI